MAGQSNPLGLSIWRWRVGGDQREIFEVAKGLVAMGYDQDLVYRVLTHLADDICPHCQGRGFERMRNAPVLTDEACAPCHGTGRRQLEGKKERDLQEKIAQLEGEIASQVMKKLARQLDL
jgi:hypothetical protein